MKIDIALNIERKHEHTCYSERSQFHVNDCVNLKKNKRAALILLNQHDRVLNLSEALFPF